MAHYHTPRGEGGLCLVPRGWKEVPNHKGSWSRLEGKGEGSDHTKFWEKAMVELLGDLQALGL